MKKLKNICTAILTGLLLTTCINKEYDLEKLKDSKMVLDPMMGAPLLYTSNMTVEQTLVRYLGKDKVGVYPDGLVYLKYAKVNFPVNASQVINLSNFYISPDQTISYTDAGWNYSGGQSTLTKNISYTFSFPNGEQIDSIVFNTLLYNIQVDITSAFSSSGTLTIEFPTLKKGGVSYSHQVSISAMNDYSNSPQIKGYSLGLTGNQFPVKYTLVLNGSIPTSGAMTIHHGFGSGGSSLDYKYIYGYIGQRDIFTTTANTPIDMFKDAKGMIFKNPTVNLYVTNSFGVPIDVTITGLSALDSSGNNIPVTIQGTHNVISLAYPNTVSDTPAVTRKSYDTTNSTIRTALNAQPRQISYTLIATANPKGKEPGLQFVKNNSNLDINMDIIFPLYGSCLRYGANDQFPFDYGELGGNATGIEFKVSIRNGLPAGGVLTMIFIGKDSVTEVDRIATNMSILEPAPTDNNGVVTGTTEHTFVLKYYHLEKLKDIKYCRISTGFHTPYNNGSNANDGVKTVKVYANNTMQIQIGMKIKFAYKLGGS